MSRLQAHPSEQVLTRITKAGTLDRRYRIPRQAAPRPRSFMGVEIGTRDDVVELIASFAVMVLMIAAVFALCLVLAGLEVPAP